MNARHHGLRSALDILTTYRPSSILYVIVSGYTHNLRVYCTVKIGVASRTYWYLESSRWEVRAAAYN